VPSGKLLREIAGAGGASYTLKFSGDGRRLIASHADASLRVYDVERGVEERTLEQGIGYVHHYDASRDGKLLAVPTDGGVIRLYDLGSGRMIRGIPCKGGDVTYVSFSPDGKWLAGTAANGTLRIWEVSGGREVHEIPDAPSGSRNAWSRNGRSIMVAGSDGEVRIFGVRP